MLLFLVARVKPRKQLFFFFFKSWYVKLLFTVYCKGFSVLLHIHSFDREENAKLVFFSLFFFFFLQHLHYKLHNHVNTDQNFQTSNTEHGRVACTSEGELHGTPAAVGNMRALMRRCRPRMGGVTWCLETCKVWDLQKQSCKAYVVPLPD